MLAGVGIAALAGPVVFGVMNAAETRAQATAATSAPLPSFEVASIKPNRSGVAHGVIVFRPGRFHGTATTVKQLIQYAYNVRGFQILGGASWTNSDRYDIDAKEPDLFAEELPKLPREQSRAKMGFLVQSLLEDRFKLKTHPETKELPVYALVVAKNGPTLQETKLISTHSGSKGSDGQRNEGFGTIGMGQIEGQGIPISARVGMSLVWMLSVELDRAVVDQTGLRGNYDVRLQWTPDESQAAMLQGPAASSPGPDNPRPESSGPSIFTALQEQLGLKLKSTRGPVEIIVVDHIERPSEN
jgi:uncharacterized protein (TIGR03435 family)